MFETNSTAFVLRNQVDKTLSSFEYLCFMCLGRKPSPGELMAFNHSLYEVDYVYAEQGETGKAFWYVAVVVPSERPFASVFDETPT